MPHALTKLQHEYLEFIREYIAKNESSPRLDELAKHFGVKAPTAHKTLKALQRKGYLYFGRDSISGFFIRLIERAGSSEIMIEIPIAGKVNKYGEVIEFPEKHGHFASVLMGAKPSDVFALVVIDEIPQEHIQEQDIIIFDTGKKPQPGDICILSFGDRRLLIKVQSKTFDRDTQSLEMAIEYPIPFDQTKKGIEQWLNWHPLAFDEENKEYFLALAEEEGIPTRSLPPDWIIAVALRLTRRLAF